MGAVWVMAVLAGCGGAYKDISAALGDATNGEALFSASCAGCHGADATGSESGPDIAGIEDNDETIGVIVEGDGSMPAFGESLSDQDISDILAWLGSL